MCLIPTGTDAPIYHWPVATAGVIALNVYGFVETGGGNGPVAEQWMLSFGSGMNPTEWLTCHFLHFGPVHLITNMIFLFAFGLVIEGKLGWLKFLLMYLLVASVGAVGLQWWMLDYDGLVRGAGGASLAIFGLIAVTLIWAPLNELTLVTFFYNRTVEFQMTYLWFGVLFIGKEFFFSSVTGFIPSSALGHSAGAIAGAAVGILMLRRKLVDCEGWDLFSVIHGSHLTSYLDRFRSSGNDIATTADGKQESTRSGQNNAKQFERRLQDAVQREDWQDAFDLLMTASESLRRSTSVLIMELIANSLYARGQYEHAGALLTLWFRERHPLSVIAILKLAAILVEVYQRPRAAQRVLDTLSSDDELSPEQFRKLRQIRREAMQQIENEQLELAETI